EEESPIAPDWSTGGSPKLITLELIFLCGMPRSRIENGVAQKLETISVKLIRSGFGYHIDDAACVFPRFCAVVACLQAKLLQRIRHGKWLVDVGVLIDVVAAIELVADLILARTVGDDSHGARKRLRRPLKRATRERSGWTGRICWIADCTCYQQTQ